MQHGSNAKTMRALRGGARRLAIEPSAKQRAHHTNNMQRMAARINRTNARNNVSARERVPLNCT